MRLSSSGAVFCIEQVIQIGIIQEESQNLKANSELQEIEAAVATLDKAITDLKDTLAAIPHQH